MTREPKQLESTIVAICTPRGAGGLGVVRLSGPQAVEIARNIFRSPESFNDPRRVQYGQFLDDAGEAIDHGLAWFLPRPRSYTGEDTVELSSHGSDVVMELIVQAAVHFGARPAEPGEFSRRAFLNGRIDLMQAEAVLDLIHAGSRADVTQAYGAASGRLSAQVESLRETILEALVQIESDLDFVEDEIEPASAGTVRGRLRKACAAIESLVAGFDGARRRHEGWLVVLVGPPNVGKSTLLNAMALEERSIVAPTAGTTRDWVEARVVWDGELIRLVDSAGLRPTADVVESEGVRRTEALIDTADVVVFVADRSSGWPSDLESHRGVTGASMLVWNKCDLAGEDGAKGRPRSFDRSKPVREISALRREGLEEVQRAILTLLPRGGEDHVAILRERHREHLSKMSACLERAIDAIEGEPEKAALDLRGSLGAADALAGKDAGEEVLDRIFAEFCIGK